MRRWYPQYWAQTWYRNTYLVRHPRDIGRATGHDREWNNICDSGCNFTCLAMVVGIDPAHLASALRDKKVFCADRLLPADYLCGRSGGLVWDRNAPNRPGQSISTPKLWHHAKNQAVSVTITLVDIDQTNQLDKGNRIVKAARREKLHVICGPEEHSHLVAGTRNGEFFIWDPDDSERQLADILCGNITLRCVFDDYPEQVIEFWKYRVTFA